MPSPIRPTDDDARDLARALLNGARFAALATTVDGHPMISRIAMATTPNGAPLSLISDLAEHTKALVTNPQCAILVGEPADKGDPLTHPRLSLTARAQFIRHGDHEHHDLAAHYLSQNPKAKLYIGFADFSLVRFDIVAAHLNGGFGKAFVLTPADLGQ